MVREINKNINIDDKDKYKYLIVSVGTKEKTVIKINRELKKLDKQILIFKNDYKILLKQRDYLIKELKDEEKL